MATSERGILNIIEKAGSYGEEFYLPAKKKIYQQGDHGESIYIVKSGTVYTRFQNNPEADSRSKNGRGLVLGIYNEGNIVGGEIFDSTHYTNTAHTATEAELIEVDKPTLWNMIADDPGVFVTISDILVSQLKATAKRRTLLIDGTASVKVDSAQDEFTQNGKTIVTQDVLADRAGMVREEFNRVRNKNTRLHRRVLKGL